MVTPINPWLTLWWLITGRSLDGAPSRHERQRLSRHEALSAYTAGSAWFSLEERERGTLAPGMLADLAVLNEDFFAAAESGIPELRSVLTTVGGRIVHAEGRFDGA